MSKRKFQSFNGYPCAPVDVNDSLWFYVDSKGLLIVGRAGGGCGHIPWKEVKRALDDHAKAKSRRSKEFRR